MAQGYTATLARLHELLQGTAGAGRPLDTDESEKAVADEPEGVPDSYELWPVGDSDAIPSGPTDIISGPLMMRTASFRLTLATFSGGGEFAPLSAAAGRLMARWQQIVMLLGDPNNRAYATSGMVLCHSFAAGEPTIPNPEQRRMTLQGTFLVRYDTATAAL